MSNTQLYRKVYCSRALPHKSGYYDSDHGKLYYDKKTEVWGLDSKPKYWLKPIQEPTEEEIEKMAHSYYGSDLYLIGQRDGYQVGFKQATKLLKGEK